MIRPRLPLALAGALIASVAAMLLGPTGCSGAEPKSDEVAPASAADRTPKPTTKRQRPVDKESRDALLREYKSLALKNQCPKRLWSLDGDWRFIGESKTPEYREVFEVRGDRFVNRLAGKPDGKAVEATVEGSIRCTHASRVLFEVDRVEPAGAFGNNKGDTYPCDVLGDMKGSGDRFLLQCYFEWDMRSSASLEFEYERIKPATP